MKDEIDVHKKLTGVEGGGFGTDMKD